MRRLLVGGPHAASISRRTACGVGLRLCHLLYSTYFTLLLLSRSVLSLLRSLLTLLMSYLLYSTYFTLQLLSRSVLSLLRSLLTLLTSYYRQRLACRRKRCFSTASY